MSIAVANAEKFLERIFYRAVSDANFCKLVQKEGIDFEHWPRRFDKARQFGSILKTSTHNVAVAKTGISVPDGFWETTPIGLEDVKIGYIESLDTCLGVDIANEIKMNPGAFKEIFKNYQKNNQITRKMMRVAELIENGVKEIEHCLTNKQGLVAFKGWDNLSEIIEGFNPGRITIVTAPTGFGKTNLGISLFMAAADSGYNCVFFNMEMSPIDIAKRILQARAYIERHEFRTPAYLPKLVQNEVASWAVKNSNSWVSDGSSLSLAEIADNIVKITSEQDLSVVFIDYDQKIEAHGKDEEWKFIQKAVQYLEEIAKLQNIHIILFSQANEDGLPRASLRAMQPASAVIYFCQDEDGDFILRFLKTGSAQQIKGLNYIMKNNSQESLNQELSSLSQILMENQMHLSISREEVKKHLQILANKENVDRSNLRATRQALSLWVEMVIRNNKLDDLDLMESIVNDTITMEWGKGSKVTFDRDKILVVAHDPLGEKLELT